MGIQHFQCHEFPDHYEYELADLQFEDNYPIITTEKDAVKCRSFAQPNWWFLPVKAQLSSNDEQKILSKIKKLITNNKNIIHKCILL